MLIFSIICIGLTVGVLVFLFFSVRKTSFTAEDRVLFQKTLLGLALFVPSAALILYLIIGMPGIHKGQIMKEQMEEHSFENLEPLVARLARRLEKEPNDVEGWMLLGRSYRALGDEAKANAAFAKADNLKQ